MSALRTRLSVPGAELRNKIRQRAELFEVERFDRLRMQSRERGAPFIDRVVHLPQEVRGMLSRQHGHRLDFVAFCLLPMT